LSASSAIRQAQAARRLGVEGGRGRRRAREHRARRARDVDRAVEGEGEAAVVGEQRGRTERHDQLLAADLGRARLAVDTPGDEGRHALAHLAGDEDGEGVASG
jgi:hypothetical protein